jgi:hypothetical protein
MEEQAYSKVCPTSGVRLVPIEGLALPHPSAVANDLF